MAGGGEGSDFTAGIEPWGCAKELALLGVQLQAGRELLLRACFPISSFPVCTLRHLAKGGLSCGSAFGEAAEVHPASQNPRAAGVGRALCGSPSPTPCPSRITHSRMHSTTSRRGWNISREGDSTASLGSLGQGSVILRGKKFFLGFSWNFLCSSLCPLPLVLALGTTEMTPNWEE